MSAAQLAERLVMFGVVPLWILAGLADWWCHRRTRIEDTSGLRENLFHWVLIAEGGVALLAVALLEINTAVLLVVLASFLVHEATTYIELRYTVPRRNVRPFEQMVHSFMEILPLAMLGLAGVVAWARGDLALRLKPEPWPAAYLAALALAVTACNLVPLAEESWRCVRAARRGPAGRNPR